MDDDCFDERLSVSASVKIIAVAATVLATRNVPARADEYTANILPAPAKSEVSKLNC